MNRWKAFIILTISTIIMAVGIYFFKFPNHFTFGGVTGLAIIIANVTPFNPSDITFVVNMVLLLIGFMFLGKNFAIRTAYSSILLSTSLSLLERAFPMQVPFTTEPMLELAFAIALPALGSAILFNLGASSGGTDVIAMLLKKYTSVNIGVSLFLTDLIIVCFAFFIFDIKTGLFSLLGLTMKSFMVDGIIENINMCKYCTVISEHPNPINDYIVHTLKRSATITKGTGAFTGTEKYIIITALNRHQAVRLRAFIKETDKDAFILISNTSEIIGKGFHSI